MPSFEPPDDCPGTPKIVHVNRGRPLWRVHHSAFGPTEFNPRASSNPYGGGRFDSADGSYSYLYAGRDQTVALAETLLRDLPQNTLGTARVLERRRLDDRRLSQLEVQHRIPVVELSGEGLQQLGQDTWLVHCDANFYPHTRAWAAAIREWAPDAQGFTWRSRHDDSRWSYVFFGDRMRADALVKSGRTRRLTSRSGLELVEADLARYAVSLS